jgi:hypothetical protein
VLMLGLLSLTMLPQNGCAVTFAKRPQSIAVGAISNRGVSRNKRPARLEIAPTG